ncbi:hypothetical protein D9C73_011577 [Collichthys lucidus]|uniref:Uncharacterized protein n=1 Tax=Collichthys lucidus TaxID=240159 RepID=A0A4U5UQY2_COLLU|nr:hypothetical protein D9C73_011577 [Collichthys lucidus]
MPLCLCVSESYIPSSHFLSGGYNTFIHHSPEKMDWQKSGMCLDESHAELVDAYLPYGGSQESINHSTSGPVTSWFCLSLMRRMSSMGLPVYCHVHQLNRATVNTMTSLGFTACPSMENISVLLRQSLSEPKK